MADNSAQRSTLKEFLASIATIKGDLSNITAPPFVLADKSTTELPRYWIEHPDLFCAPAAEHAAEKRMLAVLKWFLSSLKAQQYAGRDPSEGTKKPLNAFLGEVFVGACGPEEDETRLVSEQVSHHPPVTACYLWNEKAGIRAEGYTRQEITFTGSVNIQQFGHAILHIDAYDEDYLIPLPNIKVKGILTGSPYPELTEPCAIVSSSGYLAEIDFTGKGFLGVSGKKNHVEAAVYRAADARVKDKKALFTVEGSWSEEFTFKDAAGKSIDTYDVSGAEATDFRTLPLQEQDPFESRKAWNGVISSIGKGDMQGVSDSKNELENAQRKLRDQSETGEDQWQALFFRREKTDDTAQKLLNEAGKKFDPEMTRGVWRFDADKAASLQKPWRGGLTPHG